MVEQADFPSAAVLYNGDDKTAVIWRHYFVSFYNNSDDYVNKIVESFLCFDEYCEAYSAAYFWAGLDD